MKNEKPDFNKNHPERRPDEVFITNASDTINSDPAFEDFELEVKKRSSFECIGWKTKRRGNTAYDIYGVPLDER